MRLEPINSSSTSASTKLQQEHQVQDLFSSVLAAAGREGYASANLVEESAITDEVVQSSWNDWFASELNGRYQQVQQPKHLQQAYGEILVRAHDEGGYVDPQSFLQALSSDELAVVQQVQHLARPIQVDGLSEEGAINLLLPPAAQIDLNHDGLTQSGAAYGIRFPDSRTPPQVAAAWEEATADLSFPEKAIYELQMKLPILTANLHVDSTGTFVRQIEPGDPEFRNPLAAADYSYVQATEDQLGHLEFVKPKISPERYQRQKAFWTELQGLLVKNGAT